MDINAEGSHPQPGSTRTSDDDDAADAVAAPLPVNRLRFGLASMISGPDATGLASLHALGAHAQPSAQEAHVRAAESDMGSPGYNTARMLWRTAYFSPIVTKKHCV